MRINEKQLLELKEEIEKAKNKLAELKGRKEYLLQELKDKWGCESLEEAQNKIDLLNDEINNLETTIEKEIEELENEYRL